MAEDINGKTDMVPEEQSEGFADRIFDQSAGSVTVKVTGESFRAVPLSGGVKE